jgi:hypothetical protein
MPPPFSPQGGVSGANIQVGYFGSNNEAVVFEPAGPGAWTRTISNVRLFTAVMHLNKNSVVFRSAAPTDTLSNVHVGVNFAVFCGSEAPAAQSAGVLFVGAAPTLRDAEVAFQAVDPAQFVTRTQFRALQSLASAPVDNFRFRSDVWTGGFETPGVLVDGAFK